MKAPVLITIFAIVLFGSWWFLKRANQPGPKDASPRLAKSIPDGGVILRIHGSNTIGADLGPALVTAYFRSLGAANIQSKPIAKAESRIEGTLPGETAPVGIEIFAHGSKTAFSDLAAGRCDIGMSSRKIEPKELAGTSALGDLTSHGSEHVLGMDGVAVIVNGANPVKTLTKDRLAKIFSGSITDWAAVGGLSGPIHVFSLDENSGTWETFRTLVLKDLALVKSAVRLEAVRELSSKVSGDEHAIGFVGLPYILSAKAIAVSESESGGGVTTPLYPNRLTVATEDYPLSRRLFLYTPANPRNQWTQKFIDFAISKAGQAVVGEKGFVSQTPVMETADCSACPARYRQLTTGKSRLTLNFRFLSGQTALDNKALVDINRVVDLLVDLKFTGSGVVLLGFADNRGSREINLALSKNRAQAVAREFKMHGVIPEAVEGMGTSMPVASNDDVLGQEKNRRVEIWVNR